MVCLLLIRTQCLRRAIRKVQQETKSTSLLYLNMWPTYSNVKLDESKKSAVDAEATARIAGDSSILAAQFFSDTVDLVNGEYDVVFGTIPGVGSFTASCFTNNGQIRFVSNMGSTNYYYAIGSQLRTGSSQWNIAGIPDILPVVIVGSTGEMLEFLVQENSGGGDCQFNVAGHALVQQ